MTLECDSQTLPDLCKKQQRAPGRLPCLEGVDILILLKIPVTEEKAFTGGSPPRVAFYLQSFPHNLLIPILLFLFCRGSKHLRETPCLRE